MHKATWLLGAVSLAGLLYVGALLTMNGFGPVSLVIGETIDVRHHVTLEYSDPAFGVPPNIDKIWDAPSQFRIWGDDYLSPPVVRGSTVFVHAADCHLYAIDLTTNSKKWGRDANCYPKMPLSANNSTVIMVGSGIQAYASESGTLLWERTGLHVNFMAHHYLDEDILILPLIDKLVAIHVATGSTAWIVSIPGLADIALSSNTVIATSGSTLHVLASQSGRNLWKIEVSDIGIIKTVAAGHGAVVVSDWEHQVAAIDLMTHSKRWQKDVRLLSGTPSMEIGGLPNYGDEPIFLSPSQVHISLRQGFSKSWYTVDIDTGTVLWTASGPLALWQPVLCGIWMCGLGDGGATLLAIDLETGKLAWRFKIEHPYVHGEGLFISGNEGYLTNGDDVFQFKFGP